MKAVFLAAGFSTRLYPLTKNFPKGLLKIKDQPIISFLLDEVLQEKRITDITVICNQTVYQPYANYLSQDQYKSVSLLSNGVSQLDNKLGAIGDLQLALDKKNWHQEDVLVLPSDTLVSISISNLLSFFEKRNTITNVVIDLLDKTKIKKKLGCAIVTNSNIVSFQEKPQNPNSSITSVPIYVYPKNKLHLIKEYLQKGGNPDSPGAIIPWLLQKTTIAAYQIKNGFYFDIGDVETYKQLSISPNFFTAC